MRLDLAPPLRALPDGVTRVTPFGVRFVDPANGKPVHDGLRVALYPESRPDRRCDAYVTAGGVFAVQRVPDLGAFDRGDGRRAFWQTALGTPKPYVVEVQDLLGRFMPMSLRTTLPTPGPFGTGPLASGLPPAVPLVSAATRRAPPAAAVVRADLLDTDGRPLKHAMLIVRCAGHEVGSGIADKQGRVAVMFNHPEPAADSAFEWTLDLQLFCAAPATGITDPALPAAPPERAQLMAQRNGAAWKLFATWDATAGTGDDFVPVRLQLGHELVLKTSGWPGLLATPA